jgi:hypothetical protein
MTYPKGNKTPPSQRQDDPVVESVVRIHYDNDLDDESNGPEEERPLIALPQPPSALTERSNLRSIGRRQEGSDHSLHTLQGKLRATGGGVRGEATKTNVQQWGEWCRNNGLHPSTWTGQTYIKGALLATLVTLVVLAFTVFRVQDHIKDILRYV